MEVWLRELALRASFAAAQRFEADHSLFADEAGQ
jgi:hypothetical protein